MQADGHRFRQGDAVQLALTGQVLEVTSIAVLVEWSPPSGWTAGYPPHHLRPATAPCCPLHGRNCERGGEECCRYCTESGHDALGFRTGQHQDGSLCSKPDLSSNQRERARPPEPRPMLSEPDLMQAAIGHILAFGQPTEPDPATLRKYDTDAEFHAAVRMAAELLVWKLQREREQDADNKSAVLQLATQQRRGPACTCPLFLGGTPRPAFTHRADCPAYRAFWGLPPMEGQANGG